MLARGVAVLLITASLVSAQPKTKAKAEPTIGRTLPPPKDESGRDKTLAAFFVRLKDVLKRKDRDALLALISPDIDIGVPNMQGPSAFYTAWDLRDPNSGVYALISQILSMPGVWVQDQFCGPYVGVQFPADLDPSKYQVVLNPDVKLRETASQTGRVLGTLSYNIVEVIERGVWTKIRTESGLTGYVQIAYLYSPAAYRMCVAKNADGVWQVVSLRAGR
jgi:hypothetical protein